MVKTLSSRISDPRPRINVTLASDDDRTLAQISKGFVNIQRGSKTAILRMPYGEIHNLIALLTEADRVLEANGYKTDEPDEELAVDTTDTIVPSGRNHGQHAAETPAPTDNPFAA